MPWKPGSYAANLQLETPYEDVPEHLQGPLLRWVESKLSSAPVIERLAVDLRFRLDDNPYQYSGSARKQVLEECSDDPERCLDVVEYLLHTYNLGVSAYQDLEALLAAGNSAYAVRADRAGLEMRTTPEVQAQVQQVVTTAAGSAGEHLANAWNEAYSRTPDPVKSYSESIKAVEAALAPVVSPNNLKATLGTLIGQVNANPATYKFVIGDGTNSDGVGTALGLMRLLWEGQTSRHGGVNPTRHETTEEAQAAVHIAATLVQYGVSGAFAVA